MSQADPPRSPPHQDRSTTIPDVQIDHIANHREFLQTVLESSTEYSIIAMDLKGRVLLYNEGARRNYGYTAEEVLGEDSRIFHPDEDVRNGTVEKVFATALEKGKYEGVLQRRRKGGEAFTARVVYTVLRDPGGIPLGFLLVSKDITQEEVLKRKLVESEEYNQRLIESNLDALITTDPLGLITDVNKRMEELTEWPRERLIGSPFKDYCTDPSIAESGVRRVLAEDRITNLQLTLNSRTGKHTLVSFSATTYRGRDGKLRGVFAAARDVSDQKGLESDLRESQNYNRGLMESSLDALIVVDTKGVIIDLNRQMEGVTGYPREELVGSRFSEYFADSDRANAGIQRALSQGLVTNYDLVLQPLKGEAKDVSFTASVFKDIEGRVKGIFGSARDITERKRLQEQLEESQLYNRSLIEASPDALVTVDPDFLITDVNEQMVAVTGYSREELIGTGFKTYFEDPNLAVSGIRQIFAQGLLTNYELTLKPRNRAPLPVSLNASVFRGPDGGVKGIFASARDITEQRALDEKLRELQHYNRGLIEACADAMVSVDENLLITDVNEQMIKSTGVPRKQLVGSLFTQYFTEPDRAAAAIRQTLEQGLLTNYELLLRSKTSQQTPVSFNATVFRDVEGRVRGVFASARDITDQKKLEGQLRESQHYNRGLIESSVDALLTTDAIGTVTEVNRQMEVLTGVSRDQLIGTPLRNYFAQPERAEEGIRRVLEQNRLTNFELLLRSSNGRQTQVSLNANTFRGADGTLKGIFASSRDVTEQKRLEADLREAQNYNRSLIEASVDGLIAIDSSLMITDVNEQMVKVTGYTRAELVGSPFPDYFIDPLRAGEGVRQTLREGIVTNYELAMRSRQGRLLQVSFNASVFKDTEGLTRGVFASARDITEQKRLREQLRESQMYNRSLIEASPDALVTVDPDLVITDVNEQLVKLTEVPRDHLIGSLFTEYFTDPERAASGVRRTLREGWVTNYELVLQSRDGKRTMVSFNAAVFKDAEGKVAGIFATARDITAQKKTEEKLRDAQNYNRGLIEASPDALVTVATDLVITDVNEQMLRLTGYTRKHLIGSRFPELFTDPNRADQGVARALQDGTVSNYELTLRKRNSQKIPVSFNAGTAYDMAGNVRGVLAAARDITEQKKLEAQLRESQNYNRGLVESNIDGLMTTDVLGSITDVNKQMEALTGLSRDQLIGTPFKKYFTEPMKAEEGIRHVLSENKVSDFELTMRTPDRRTIDISYNATTFRDTEGRLRGVFAALRDVTEKKRLREQIEQRNRELEVQNQRVEEANRLKSEFLANMSHELRTPLNSIIGFSEFLLTQENKEFRPDQVEYLSDILSSGHHLLQLINDVLDLAKVEAGKMELAPFEFSAQRAIVEVCAVVKPLVDQKRIQLTTDLSTDVDMVILDPLRFKQILFNLLSNAVKFTDDGGKVEVQLRSHDERSFVLQVSDSGIGISRDDIPRLFRQFQQLDAGPGRRFQGSGLGLSLTKRLVELQGGRIDVTSEVGQGSQFTVLLPLSIEGNRHEGPTSSAAAT